MPMPRVVPYTAPSATVLNTYAQELDNLGTGCKVKRTSAQTGITTNTDLLITWQAAEYDTFLASGSPMWVFGTANYITIRVAGVYTMVLQERWAAAGGGTGQRAGKIMVNGSSVFTNSVATDKRAADGTAEGVTLQMRAVVPCNVGDIVYANYWTSAGSTITGLQTDFGGTFLSVNRLGPLSA